MRSKLLTTAAIAAALCAASSSAIAGPPSELQLFVTICSNNGNGNGNEVVTVTGLPRCDKFQGPIPSPIESPTFPNNNQLGEEGCTDGADCDPKPAE